MPRLRVAATLAGLSLWTPARTSSAMSACGQTHAILRFTAGCRGRHSNGTHGKAMFIYLITNLVNGKVYVGQTRVGLHKRLTGHTAQARSGSKYPLHAAIRKYGRDSFLIEALAVAETREQLDQLEVLWISILNSRDMSVGYNVMSGGLSGVLTPEAEAHKADKLRGRKRTLETRDKMSASAKIRAATMWTPERRAAHSARMSGAGNPSFGKPFPAPAGSGTRAAANWVKENPVTHRRNCRKASQARWEGLTPEERAAQTKPMRESRWAEKEATSELANTAVQ